MEKPGAKRERRDFAEGESKKVKVTDDDNSDSVDENLTTVAQTFPILNEKLDKLLDNARKEDEAREEIHEANGEITRLNTELQKERIDHKNTEKELYVANREVDELRARCDMPDREPITCSAEKEVDSEAAEQLSTQEPDDSSN